MSPPSSQVPVPGFHGHDEDSMILDGLDINPSYIPPHRNYRPYRNGSIPKSLWGDASSSENDENQPPPEAAAPPEGRRSNNPPRPPLRPLRGGASSEENDQHQPPLETAAGLSPNRRSINHPRTNTQPLEPQPMLSGPGNLFPSQRMKYVRSNFSSDSPPPMNPAPPSSEEITQLIEQIKAQVEASQARRTTIIAEVVQSLSNIEDVLKTKSNTLDALQTTLSPPSGDNQPPNLLEPAESPILSPEAEVPAVPEQGEVTYGPEDGETSYEQPAVDIDWMSVLDGNAFDSWGPVAPTYPTQQESEPQPIPGIPLYPRSSDQLRTIPLSDISHPISVLNNAAIGLSAQIIPLYEILRLLDVAREELVSLSPHLVRDPGQDGRLREVETGLELEIRAMRTHVTALERELPQMKRYASEVMRFLTAGSAAGSWAQAPGGVIDWHGGDNMDLRGGGGSIEGSGEERGAAESAPSTGQAPTYPSDPVRHTGRYAFRLRAHDTVQGMEHAESALLARRRGQPTSVPSALPAGSSKTQTEQTGGVIKEGPNTISVRPPGASAPWPATSAVSQPPTTTQQTATPRQTPASRTNPFRFQVTKCAGPAVPKPGSPSSSRPIHVERFGRTTQAPSLLFRFPPSTPASAIRSTPKPTTKPATKPATKPTTTTNADPDRSRRPVHDALIPTTVAKDEREKQQRLHGASQRQRARHPDEPEPLPAAPSDAAPPPAAPMTRANRWFLTQVNLGLEPLAAQQARDERAASADAEPGATTPETPVVISDTEDDGEHGHEQRKRR